MSFVQDHLRKVDEIIRRVGWCVQGVGGGDDDPPFAYTVGLTETFGHPEIFIVGFGFQMSQNVLNSAADAIRRGHRLDSNKLADEVIQNFPVAVRTLGKKQAGARGKVARARYAPKGFEAVQMFLPDASGRFPWDPACDPKYAEVQTRLFGPVTPDDASRLAPQ